MNKLAAYLAKNSQTIASYCAVALAAVAIGLVLNAAIDAFIRDVIPVSACDGAGSKGLC